MNKSESTEAIITKENRGVKDEKNNFKTKSIYFKIIKNIFNINKKSLSLIPPQYFFERIKKDIFPKLNLKPEMKESFNKNESILILEDKISDKSFLGRKTRNRDQKNSPEKKQKRMGRKKINYLTDSKHNKNSPDNIIKKIKSNLLDNHLLNFVNDILNIILSKEKKKYYLQKSPNDKKKIIKKIDYKHFVDDMKRENNLEFLKLSLKSILSKDISKKYSILSKKFNEEIIKEILLEKNNNEIINFIFNLTLGEWFDLFTYKKELSDIPSVNEKITKILNNKFEKVRKTFRKNLQK